MHEMAHGLRQRRKRQWYAAIRALLYGPQFEVSQFSYNSNRNFQALSGRAFKRLHTVLCNVTNLGWMNHTSAYFSSKKDNSWTKIWREEPSPVPVLNMHQNQNLVKTQIQKFWLLHAPEILYAPAAMSWLFFKLLAFFRNCFLCWDCWNGDEMPTLDQGKAWLSITTRRYGKFPNIFWKLPSTCLFTCFLQPPWFDSIHINESIFPQPIICLITMIFLMIFLDQCNRLRLVGGGGECSFYVMCGWVTEMKIEK